MSRKLIWLTSALLSLVVYFAARAWKPYWFGRFIMEGAINQWSFEDWVSNEPALVISGLLIGFNFLLFTNILHTLFYRRKA